MNCINEKIGNLLSSYELGLLSDEERKQFEGHLPECDFCTQELYRTAPITNLIREKRLAPSNSKKEPSPIFVRPWVYAAAITLVAFTLTALWLLRPDRKTELYRGNFEEASILVLSPVQEVTSVKEFKWKAVSGVETYKLKVYNEAGDIVWEQIEPGLTAILPISVRETFVQGDTYFWQVETQLPDGVLLKSKMIRFWIRK